MRRQITDSGCQCSGCRATNALQHAGFTAWPKGAPVGKRGAQALYAEHVRACLSGGVVSAIGRINTDPVSFYGVPRGGSRREVLDTLARAFAGTSEE